MNAQEEQQQAKTLRILLTIFRCQQRKSLGKKLLKSKEKKKKKAEQDTLRPPSSNVYRIIFVYIC